MMKDKDLYIMYFIIKTFWCLVLVIRLCLMMCMNMNNPTHIRESMYIPLYFSTIL